MSDKSYDEQIKYRKKLASRVWCLPFSTCRLDEFTKKELLTMLEAYLEMVSFEKFFDYDIKDLLFAQKCSLVEALDPDYFKKL